MTQEARDVITAARDLAQYVRDKADKHITEVNLIVAIDAFDKVERLPQVKVGGESFTMKAVQSSNVKAVAYNAATRTLLVEFDGGAYYSYANVPPHKHASLMASPSIGAALNTLIKGAHEYKRVDATLV